MTRSRSVSRRGFVLSATGIALLAGFQAGSQAKPHKTSGNSLLYTASEGEASSSNRVVVKGTSIDLPLVCPTVKQGNAFFLTHDATGAPATAGCPFVDCRCSTGSQHLLIYGHSLGIGTEGFTELRNAWNPEVFATIDGALITLNGVTTTYKSLLAARIDKNFDGIQRFSFTGSTELAAWIDELVRSLPSPVISDTPSTEDARRALSLITCSSVRPGKRGRTLVMFTSTA